MGVKIAELLPRKELELSDLSGKRLAIDTSLFLYQFLASIRQQDGRLFTNKEGKVTSHIIGLFHRTTKLMAAGIKLCFVLDGKPHELKHQEIARRAGIKAEAARLYAEAEEQQDTEEMKKYASRNIHLTKEMIEEAKEVIALLGIPIIQAPGEAEAQASFLVKRRDVYAVASQDADSFLFGTERLLRNLAITGRKKKTGTLATVTIKPELFILSEILEELKISHEEFIALGMLVGTDFNIGGIKGIGPKKALAIMQKHQPLEKVFEEVGWQEHFDVDWREIYEIFHNPNVTADYSVIDENPNFGKLKSLLIETYGFSEDRVNNGLKELQEAKELRAQQGLSKFL